MSDIYVGEDGKLHKTKGGADTVIPFKNYEIKEGTFATSAGATNRIELGKKPLAIVAIGKGLIGTYFIDTIYNHDGNTNPTRCIVSVDDTGFTWRESQSGTSVIYHAILINQ